MPNLQVYQYTSLPTGKHIRVIRLLPSRRFKNPIKILLDVFALEPPPEYEALSYALEGQTPDQPIDCGGRRLMITQTCLNALRRLRRKLHPRTLWIDGIRIDQKTTEEKNHQVALMGPIYSSAQQVVVWLGEDRKGVDLLLKLLRQNRLICYLQQGVILQSSWLSSWLFSCLSSVEHRHFAYMYSRLSGHGLDLSTLNESIPWFSRLWTVQEVELSRKAVYMQGRTEDYFHSIHLNLISTFANHHSTTYGSLDSPFEYQRILLTLRMTRGVIASSWSERLHLVRKAALGKAALPHDKIYAIRAILQLGLEQDAFPLPNYDLDFKMVHWKTCVILMCRCTRGLKLIQDVGSCGNTPGIPSWVADFDRPIQVFNSVLTTPSLSLFDNQWYKPTVFGNDSKLATRSQLLTTVTGIIDHQGLDKAFGVLKTDEERTCAVMSATECAWLWIKTWDTLSMNPNSSGSSYHLTDLMFRNYYTLVESHPMIRGLFDLIHKADESTFDQARFQEHLKANYQATRTEMTSLIQSTPTGINIDLAALLSWNKEPDDVDSKLVNGIWDVFRIFWDSCHGSALFWTEEKTMGISLPVRRVGVVVALIPGLDWPMLLRKSANGNFKVVGPAFIHECHKMFRRDELQDIVLE